MASQQYNGRIFTPSKSPLQNSFFQKGQVSRSQLPQRVNQNYQFTFENMPKVNCHYHTDQYITMFCRSQTCQMPLCPQCIKIHSQEHQQYGTYGDFDTLEGCLTEAYQVVAGHCNKFVDELNHVHRLSGSVDSVQQYMDKVKQARQQCYQVIDNFFNTLEQELLGEVDQNRSFTVAQSQNFSKYLQSRWKNLMSFLEKLNTEKCVKGLVKFYCSDFERENEEYFHETIQFTKQLERCTPEILIDQSAIYELNLDLAKFVSLKRVSMYQGGREVRDYSHTQQPYGAPPQQTSYPANQQSAVNQQYMLPVSSQNELHTKTIKPESRHENQRQESLHPYLQTPTKSYHESK